MLRVLGRKALRAWGWMDKAPGYLYQAVERYGPSLANSNLLPSRLPNGCQVRCDLKDEVQRHMWFYGAYEPIEAYLFTRFLEPGMVVIDAGANVGQYTLLAATAVGSSGAVHSFEPVPETFTRLQEHVLTNGLTNVHLVQAALWDEDIPLGLHMPVGVQNNLGAYRVSARGGSTGEVKVPGVRLDTYATRHGLVHIDLIKMDIEGSEPFALAGGWAFIEQSRPIILMEINRKALLSLGNSPERLWAGLTKLGYRAWRIGHSPQTCVSIYDLEEIEQANVLFHQHDLPADLTSGWTYRTAKRWARSWL